VIADKGLQSNGTFHLAQPFSFPPLSCDARANPVALRSAALRNSRGGRANRAFAVAAWGSSDTSALARRCIHMRCRSRGRRERCSQASWRNPAELTCFRRGSFGVPRPWMRSILRCRGAIGDGSAIQRTQTRGSVDPNPSSRLFSESRSDGKIHSPL
jgi:hypothetical protein